MKTLFDEINATLHSTFATLKPARSKFFKKAEALYIPLLRLLNSVICYRMSVICLLYIPLLRLLNQRPGIFKIFSCTLHSTFATLKRARSKRSFDIIALYIPLLRLLNYFLFSFFKSFKILYIPLLRLLNA